VPAGSRRWRSPSFAGIAVTRLGVSLATAGKLRQSMA
jgi:hypothetical protein